MRAMWLSACAAAICVLSPGVALADAGFDLDKDRKVLAPITYQNLTLMPIVSRTPAGPEDYLVLDEGMKKGVVQVVEKKDGGDVNNLVLANRSEQPLFLMAGEVIIGGKQDRIIGKDTVVPPRTTETVPVFCVEHGRWGGRKATFSTANALAHTELRKSAKYKKQGDVWNEVKSKNAKRAKSNATDTYRHVAADKKGGKGKLVAYRRHFERALAAHPQRAQIVGFVVAVNGKVAAIESFGSARLYAKLSDKLLTSYFVEAVDQPVVAGARAPDAGTVAKFTAAARRARKKKVDKVRANVAAETVQFDEDEVQGSMVTPKGRPAATPVYDSVYAK